MFKEKPAFLGGIETPKVNTNNPGTLEHKEAHGKTGAEINESLAEKSRQEIIEHYNINTDHIISVPASVGRKREMRAFVILKHAKDPEKKYYADGHLDHAVLLNIILNSFSSETGVANRSLITDDFYNEWEIKKGLIDPYMDGFKKFDSIHGSLREIAIHNHGENGLTANEESELEKNPDAKMPNWFIIGQYRGV